MHGPAHAYDHACVHRRVRELCSTSKGSHTGACCSQRVCVGVIVCGVCLGSGDLLACVVVVVVVSWVPCVCVCAPARHATGVSLCVCVFVWTCGVAECRRVHCASVSQPARAGDFEYLTPCPWDCAVARRVVEMAFTIQRLLSPRTANTQRHTICASLNRVRLHRHATGLREPNPRIIHDRLNLRHLPPTNDTPSVNQQISPTE